jgi:alginate O-acetyltransferase complex protein AlgI
MVFSSSLFLVYFFPVFLLVYYLVKKEYKNMTALAASVLFYAWGGKFFTAILFVTLIADFKLVERMAASKGEERKFMFWAAQCGSFGIFQIRQLLYRKCRCNFGKPKHMGQSNASYWHLVLYIS